MQPNPTQPNRVFVVALRAGVSWSNIQRDANTGMIHSIAIDPANSDHLLLAGRAGIARSDDSGEHWVASHSGINALAAVEVASSGASDRIYFQASGDGIYAIAAADGSMLPLDNPELRQLSGNIGLNGLGMTLIAGAPDRLFIGSGGNVARSLDGGESWSLHQAAPLQGFYRVVNASADNSRLVATTGSQLYYTADGGITWTEGAAPAANDMRVMASAPSNRQVIYLAGRLPGDTRDVMLRSADGGDSWTTRNFPSPDVHSIAVDPDNDQNLYTIAAQGEVFKSTDGSQTWTTLTVPGPYTVAGSPLSALAIDPQNPNIVYAAGGPYIARSVDAGASWQQLLPDENRSLSIRSIVVDELRPHRLYAAALGRRVREFSVQPDLRIAPEVSHLTVGHGTGATYFHRISNAGPFDATNVRAQVQLPDGVTNIAASSPSVSCTVAGTVVTCVAPILRTDANVDIEIDATHPTSGNFDVIATVEGDQPDAASADNRVTTNVTVGQVTDLSVLMTGSAIVAQGENSTLSLTITNAGPNEASVASVTLRLAEGFSVVSITPSGGTSTCVTTANTLACQLPQLGSGGSVTIAVVISPPAAAGSFTHMATVAASGIDMQGSNNVAAAVTTGSNVAQGIDRGGSGGGRGGGGSTSLFMLAALLLLSRLRAAASKF